jgi:hypothetical protein
VNALNQLPINPVGVRSGGEKRPGMLQVDFAPVIMMLDRVLEYAATESFLRINALRL